MQIDSINKLINEIIKINMHIYCFRLFALLPITCSQQVNYQIIRKNNYLQLSSWKVCHSFVKLIG